MDIDLEPIEQQWTTFERHVQIMREHVLKRELYSEEYKTRLSDGAVIYPYWAKERLRNEAATLDFLRSNTTIPVPYHCLYVQDGLLHLVTVRIQNAIELQQIDAQHRQAAAAAVQRQLEIDILPQLKAFRRDFIGSVDRSLPVFPPARIYSRDRRDWPRVHSEAQEFVFCHNDLGPHNILIDPVTFKIMSIIDWEFAGYFPPDFEMPLWDMFEWNDRSVLCESAKRKHLAFFGVNEEDLQNQPTVPDPVRR